MTDVVQIVERMPHTGPRDSKWKGERLKLLKQLVSEGLGQAAIARRVAQAFNETCTRNMVIGIMDRENLKCTKQVHVPNKPRTKTNSLGDGRSAIAVIRHKRAAGNHEARPVTLVEPETPQNDLDIPLLQRCTLLELNDTKCRWPVGSGKELFFCGGAASGKYCGLHSRIAHRDALPRRNSYGSP